MQVDTHNGIRRVGNGAFRCCRSLRRINLESVVELDEWAFARCENLEFLQFVDKLERIGNHAFTGCSSLQHLKLPSIVTIKQYAFNYCTCLADVELSERLERIGVMAFRNCERLQRIAVPLKRDLLPFSHIFLKYCQFDDCEQLATVELIGGIHKTVASLHLESWRSEMIAEINRINQILPNTPANEKTEEIHEWMGVVIDKKDHYKAEHYRYVQEGTTLLELALWKAKLGENEDRSVGRETKKAKVDSESVRKGGRITCGADTVIKNVLPFLELE